jgi:hypothetical protein
VLHPQQLAELVTKLHSSASDCLIEEMNTASPTTGACMSSTGRLYMTLRAVGSACDMAERNQVLVLLSLAQ